MNKWPITKLEESADVVTGSTPPTKDKEFYGGDYPFVSPADLGETKYIDSAYKTLSEKGWAVSRKLPKKAILFTCIGSTIGKMGIANRPMATNQQINAVIPGNKLDSEFLYYQLAYKAEEIKRMAGKQAVPLVNKTDFAATEIYIPPLAEQKKISEILACWDRVIENTELSSKKIKVLKKQLIKNFYLNSKNSSTHFLMKEIFNPIRSRSNGENEEVLAVSSTQGLISQTERFSKVIAGKSLEKYILVQKNDFTYNKGNSKDYECGRICLVEKYACGLVPNVYISFRLKNSETFDLQFFKYFFEEDLLKDELMKIINLGVRNDGLLNLKPEHFFNCAVMVPSLELQKKIGSAGRALSDNLEKLDKLLFLYKLQKQALLQHFFSSKLELDT